MITIKTRFAPSPTGYLHIGNLRTALFSWLYAKKYNGKFLIRIENTDYVRSKNKYISNIFYILEWFGLYWDEIPYYQSDRIDYYNDIINIMLKNDIAYKCFCTVERLKKIRDKCFLNNKKPKYDGYCRNISFKRNKNKSYVVRFRNVLNKNIIFNDIVYKNIKINSNELDDFIIRRSNGLPTYNLCVVLDDYDMSITHVIRGNDHINNTHKQICIIDSMKYYRPNYVHLPMILNINKKKLSKRDNLFNINNYINLGFLPESILNYIIRLGWSFGNREIFSINEMIKLFDFKNINKSSCIINYTKLLWINKYYLSSLDYKKLFFYLKPFFLFKNINIFNIKNISEIITYFSNRSNTLLELVENCILFSDKFHLNKKISKIYKYKYIYVILFYFFKNIYNISWDINDINKFMNSIINKFVFLNKKEIFMILRFFLTGKEKTISLNLLILYLGKKKTLYRILYSIKKFFIF